MIPRPLVAGGFALLGAVAVSTVAPCPVVAAAHGADMRLDLELHHRVNGRNIVAQGQKVRLHGYVTPYVPGQAVTVRVNVGARRVLLAGREIRPVGSHGEFVVDFRSPRTGRLKASALHNATNGLPRLVDDSPTAAVVVNAAGRGTGGPRVQLLQRSLLRMGFHVQLTGVYDEATGRAVMAWRKVNHFPRATHASRRVFTRIADRRGRYVAYNPSHGRHVEADLGRQVLALVYPGGRVYRVLHMSSGKPSTPTVRGSYHVYWKQPGINSKNMLHSNYFVGGYAIHGYRSVPAYPASGGCLRIPNPNARFVNRWVRQGTRIDVFHRTRRTPARQRVRPDAGP